MNQRLDERGSHDIMVMIQQQQARSKQQEEEYLESCILAAGFGVGGLSLEPLERWQAVWLAAHPSARCRLASFFFASSNDNGAMKERSRTTDGVRVFSKV
jgi:hypothetical protein